MALGPRVIDAATFTVVRILAGALTLLFSQGPLSVNDNQLVTDMGDDVMRLPAPWLKAVTGFQCSQKVVLDEGIV